MAFVFVDLFLWAWHFPKLILFENCFLYFLDKEIFFFSSTPVFPLCLLPWSLTTISNQNKRQNCFCLYLCSTLGFNPVISVLRGTVAPLKTIFSADDKRTIKSSVLHLTNVQQLQKTHKNKKQNKTKDNK